KGSGTEPKGGRGAGQSGHYRLPPAEIWRSGKILPRCDRGRSGIPTGAIQPGQPLRRAGTAERGAGTLPAGPGAELELRGRALQPGVAVRADRRCDEGRAPLEGVFEAGQFRAMGGDCAAPVGAAAADGGPVSPRPGRTVAPVILKAS